jgi:hypothetical protein
LSGGGDLTGCPLVAQPAVASNEISHSTCACLLCIGSALLVALGRIVDAGCLVLFVRPLRAFGLSAGPSPRGLVRRAVALHRSHFGVCTLAAHVPAGGEAGRGQQERCQGDDLDIHRRLSS